MFKKCGNHLKTLAARMVRSVPHRGPANIRLHRTKFIRPVGLPPRICASQTSVLLFFFSFFLGSMDMQGEDVKSCFFPGVSERTWVVLCMEEYVPKSLDFFDIMFIR